MNECPAHRERDTAGRSDPNTRHSQRNLLYLPIQIRTVCLSSSTRMLGVLAAVNLIRPLIAFIQP
jgi:hypothetical protein